MKVERNNLLVIAGTVWMVAGLNILIIGLSAYPKTLAFEWWVVGLFLLGTLVTLGVFHVMFGKMVKKHVRRIRGLEGDRVSPLRFFDAKGYLIMAFMIALGVTLRVSGIVPDWLIALFYTGLGTALMVAGMGFLLHRANGPGWSVHGDRKGRSVS